MADDELEPLITECPSCHTHFRVAEAQLDRAGGKVRCGACLTVFHGIEHLTLESAQAYADDDLARRALDDVLDELAAEPDPTAGSAERDTDQPQGAAAAPATPVPFRQRRTPPGPIFAGFEEPEGEAPEAELSQTFQVLGGPAGERGAAAAARDETDAEAAPGAKGAAALPSAPVLRAPDHQPAGGPSPAAAAAKAATDAAAAGPRPASAGQSPTGGTAFAAMEDAAAAEAGTGQAAGRGSVVFGERPPRRPLVWAGIALGLILLAAQVLWYRFDDWAKDPQWQPVYAPLCQMFGCELPQRRDSSLLATQNLAVRTHPTEPSALQVSAMIVNRADFPQPFPVLELRFTTVRGNLVAGRRFEPAEYLAGDAAGMDMMPPRTPVQIELTIDDPGPEAVNYFLQFR